MAVVCLVVLCAYVLVLGVVYVCCLCVLQWCQVCVLVSLSVVGCCGVLMKFIVVWVFLVLIVFNGLG